MNTLTFSLLFFKTDFTSKYSGISHFCVFFLFLTITAAKLNFQGYPINHHKYIFGNCTDSWKKNLSISAGCWMYKLSHFCVDVSALLFLSQKFLFELSRDMKLYFWSCHWGSVFSLMHFSLTVLWLLLLSIPLIMECMMQGYSPLKWK